MKKDQPHVSIAYGSRTDVGLVRPHNEDSLIVAAPLFAVADGMGGHEAGEVASEIAVQTLAAQAPDTADAEALGRAVVAANQAIIRAAVTGIGKPGMGTTLTAAILEDTHLIVAQVGDSRAYLLHDGQLSRLTRDHSLVARLVENGEITEEEARWHPQRSVITRALGSDPNTIPDLYDFNLMPGDRLMLCSDGLYSMVEDGDIRDIMAAHEDPQDCADALAIAAIDGGGHDNVTAVVVDVIGDADITTPIRIKPAKRRKGLIIGVIVAFICIVLAACIGTYSYARNRAYLIEEDGTVMVYRGLVGNMGPLNLSWQDKATNIDVEDLYEAIPSLEQTLPEGIAMDSLDAAYATVDYYETTIEEYQAAHAVSHANHTAANAATSSTLAGAVSESNSSANGSGNASGNNTSSSGSSSSSSSSNSGSSGSSNSTSGSSSSSGSGSSNSSSNSTTTSNGRRTN